MFFAESDLETLNNSLKQDFCLFFSFIDLLFCLKFDNLFLLESALVIDLSFVPILCSLFTFILYLSWASEIYDSQLYFSSANGMHCSKFSDLLSNVIYLFKRIILNA